MALHQKFVLSFIAQPLTVVKLAATKLRLHITEVGAVMDFSSYV